MEKDNKNILLHLRNVYKQRGESDRKIQIEIPELTIHKGEFVAVVGANGSGKSTLLDMLGLILSPDSVDKFVMMAGQKPQHLAQLSTRQKLYIRRNHLSYVLQTGGLLEFLTVRENIHLAGKLANKENDKTDEMMEKMGITDIQHKRPGRVSGGQRQKTAIARALVQEPDIILADEPTSALDSTSAKKLMETFVNLTNQTNSTLIMVTHDHELIHDCAHTHYQFISKPMDNGSICSALHRIPRNHSA